MRHTKTCILIVLLILLLLPTAAFAQTADSSSTPVFLNGEPAYLHNSDTNFSNILTTAIQQKSGADIVIINSDLIHASIPAGIITPELLQDVFPVQSNIVTTTLSGAQLKKLLTDAMNTSATAFPHVAGIEVIAQKHTDANQKPVVTIKEIYQHELPISDTDSFTVATTDTLFSGGYNYKFPNPKLESFGSVSAAFIEFLNGGHNLPALYNDYRLYLLETPLDTADLITKLRLDVPSDIYVSLAVPSVIPDTVVNELVGKNRTMIFNFIGERPYMLSFNGNSIATPLVVDGYKYPALIPTSISLDSQVSQTLPANKKRASSVDEHAIYIDFSKNSSLPPSTVLKVYTGDVYAPGTTVYPYYYDAISDIVPFVENGLIVDETGYVSLAVNSDTTYLLNSTRLNATTFFTLPTKENPFIGGIVVLISLFALWVILFFIAKKRHHKTNSTQE
ncbi:MAG: 5'-nucleotidase [Christensenellaceae bacterium]